MQKNFSYKSFQSYKKHMSVCATSIKNEGCQTKHKCRLITMKFINKTSHTYT